MVVSKRKIKSTKGRKEDKKDSQENGIFTEQPEKKKRKIESEMLLNSDEADFPRGGGSILTPLEYKEAVNEGIREVFENDKTNDSKRKRTKRYNGSKQHGQEVISGPKVEGLSYKRVVQGSLILGRISRINSLGLVVSLPNNLSGFIPITSISTFLTSKVEAVAEHEEFDSEEQNIPSLTDMFTVGQWVRGAVISFENDKNKQRITLSIEPVYANVGLSVDNVVPGVAIMASVKSIEDHGIICDVGLEGINGFIKKKEYGKHNNFKQGQTLLVYLKSILNRTLQLTLNTQTDEIKVAPSIEAFSPGTLAQLLITDVSPKTARGKIMGHLDATIDLFHCGCLANINLDQQIKEGHKIPARVIATFPDVEPPKVALSLLPQVLSLEIIKNHPLEALPIGFILETVKVIRVEADIGLFCNVGLDGVLGFIHISRLSDKKVDFLASNVGKYKVGTQHRARILGFNSVDNLFILSAEESVLSKPFLRVEDIEVGRIVDGKVLKIIPAGLLVQLTDKITGLVPTVHMADTLLRNPERKFREGENVKCRVLKSDGQSRKVFLTCKKTLIHSEYPVITCYEDVKPGQKATGVLSKLLPNGAVVEFYKGVHAFLPVSEMSEAYISDPKDHFHVGQTVLVHVLFVDSKEEKIKVSCRDSTSVTPRQGKDFTNFSVGKVVSGTVESKTREDVIVKIAEADAKGIIILGHLSDGTTKKCIDLQQKFRIGQIIHELVILDINRDKKTIYLSAKKSLVKAAKENKFPKSIDECKIKQEFKGYIKSITDYGVFVGFAGNFVGLALRQNLADNYVPIPSSIFTRNQSVTAYILGIDHGQQRVQLSLKPVEEAKEISPILDSSIKSMGDFKPGRITKAKILSVKETQINMQLEYGVQGRIDSSAIFDTYESIPNPKRPLKHFKVGQTLEVMVLGVHEAKYKRGLAITHKTSNVRTILDLALNSEMLTLESIKLGSQLCVFVNNTTDDGLWVNITPNIRGRIHILDISDDIECLNKRYPIGMALQAKVIHIDEKQSIVHLSLRDKPITSYESVHIGSLLAGKITKISEYGMMVQLSECIIGRVFPTDLSDDYSLETQFSTGQIARVCVVQVDYANHKIALSVRASRVLSSLSKVVDPEIISIDDLKVGQVVRGFIKNIADHGLFVSLSRNITARVKISELSDDFVQEWKKLFSPMQLVKGKIMGLDLDSKQIEMSLKKSRIDSNLGPRLGLAEYQVGQIIDGTVRKVEEFGVFIRIEKSANVSGLCHRSEISENKVADARGLFSEGDLVKAKILKLDIENRKLSFGLKPSYFVDHTERDTEDVPPEDVGSSQMDVDNVTTESVVQQIEPLVVEGFDWSGETMNDLIAELTSESEKNGPAKSPKKKRKKTVITIDKTADLATRAPESAADYERLILGSPDSSYLWVNYMAFLLQFSEIEKAREIGERALKTINFREEEEKMNVWIALLNLESSFGTENSLEDTFKKSCQYNDSKKMYFLFTEILTKAGNWEKADECWNTMLKTFRTSCKVWIGYAQFLTDHGNADSARELLSQSKKSLPVRKHIKITVRFAQLEFRNGDPERGRTIFEGLLSDHPKRLDLWNVLIDLETKQDNKDGVRWLFQRVLSLKISSRNAKSLFKKWLDFEKRHGDETCVEHVRSKAIEYVENLGA